MTAKAAVPKAIQEALREARPMPGHVFSLYLPFWSPENDWSEYEHSAMGEKAKLWALLASAGIQRKKTQRIKGQTYYMQTPAPLSQIDNDLLQGLRRRQQHLAEASGALTIKATSVSPFVTGMGEEHAVENGFAFLSPYGLPYLAGSGVKGVIRRAAEELAAGLNPDGTKGWTFTRIMWLFGFEGNAGWMESDPEKGRAELLAPAWEKELASLKDTNEEAAKLAELLGKRNDELIGNFFKRVRLGNAHLAGALSFWDVIIDVTADKDRATGLDLDILTPHYGKYYEGVESPHDASQPQPNPFLVVAPGAHFTFHVTCAEHRLPPSLRGDVWRDLVQAAFEHAFEWGGFGAKTAVGYGVLQRTNASDAEQPSDTVSEQRQQKASPSARPESSSPFSRGQRVVDTDSGETGIIVEVRGNIAIVDFDGEEDEVPLDQLKKA